MSKHTDEDRCLALAGVFQAAELVQSVARARPRSESAMAASLGSLFQQNPATALDTFGGNINGLRLGLESLCERLGRPAADESVEPTRYTLGLLHLERRLRRRPALLGQISERLENAQRLVAMHTLQHPAVIQALGELYRDTLSTLGPRIMISGDPAQLRDAGRQALIRALLLAGIRAAVLWRQCGGSRWSLLLGRRALIGTARGLLQQ